MIYYYIEMAFIYSWYSIIIMIVKNIREITTWRNFNK